LHHRFICEQIIYVYLYIHVGAGNEIYPYISLFQKVLTKIQQKSTAEFGLISPFIESCVEICWGMVVHEPKLGFLWLQEGQDKKVNPDQFTLYTRSGKGVEFLVWPAMLLHENGPVLRKGTYQPFKEKRRK